MRPFHRLLLGCIGLLASALLLVITRPLSPPSGYEFWDKVSFHYQRLLDTRYLPALLFHAATGTPDYGYRLAYDWTQYRRVAHALGAIPGQVAPNSKEAFLRSYQRGHRVFEIDLIMTRDGHLVAKHDWYQEGGPLVYQDYITRASLTQTPLTASSLIDLLSTHRDAYLITDTKAEMSTLLSRLIAEAKKRDPSVIRRVIPQIYSETDLPKLLEVHPFQSVIYTLYRTRDSDEKVIRFVQRNQIGVVTMSGERYSSAFAKRLASIGTRTFVHTVNDPKQAAWLARHAVYGIYTDSLPPD